MTVMKQRARLREFCNKNQTSNEEDILLLLNGSVDWKIPSILHWVCSESGSTKKQNNSIPQNVCEADDSNVLSYINDEGLYREALDSGTNNVFYTFDTLDFSSCIKKLQKEILICFNEDLNIADCQYKDFIRKKMDSISERYPSVFIPKITNGNTSENIKNIIEKKDWGTVERVYIKNKSIDKSVYHTPDNFTQYAFVTMRRWGKGVRATNVRHSLILDRSVSLIEEEGNVVVCRRMKTEENFSLAQKKDFIRGCYLPEDLY